MLSRFSFILVLSILCLTLPLAALATKPAGEKWSTVYYPGDPLVFCDYEGEDNDFLIRDDLYLSFTWRAFEDKEGNVIRDTEKYRFDDELYNEDFPDGIRLKGNAVANHQFYYEGDSVRNKITGVPVQITLPGYGPLFFQAGLQMLVDGEYVFVRGAHQDWSSWEIDEICDYLSDQ